MNSKHIHVLNTHGLGDMVMTLPMLREIDQDGFRISLTVKSKLEAELVRQMFVPKNGALRFIHFQDYAQQGIRGYFGFLVALRKLKADMIMPAIGVSEVRYNLLAFFSGARYRVGHGGKLAWLNHFNWRKGQPAHKVVLNNDIYLQALASWQGISRPAVKPRFPPFNPNASILEELRARFPGLLDANAICLAPGSGEVEKHKRWPIEKYADLAVKLLEQGRSVVVLGGSGEEPLGAVIAAKAGLHPCFYDLTGQLSLGDTLNLLNSADKLVANCNGLSHMASAVDTTVVGLYGPTDPHYTGPYSDKLQIVTLALDCAPCYRRGFIMGCGKPVCMKDLSLNNVDFSLVKGRLSNEADS